MCQKLAKDMAPICDPPRGAGGFLEAHVMAQSSSLEYKPRAKMLFIVGDKADKVLYRWVSLKGCDPAQPCRETFPVVERG